MASLKFDSYLPSDLTKRSEKELRAEYTRLRDIAVKRLKRLGASEYKSSAAYQINKNKFIKLGQMKNADELASRLSDLSRFVSARSSSITGQRGLERDRIMALQESGYDFVNKSNLREFGLFMNYLKSLFPRHPSADAETAQQLFTGYRELRGRAKSPEDMQELFMRFLEREAPNTYFLRPSFTDVPEHLKVKTPWN